MHPFKKFWPTLSANAQQADGKLKRFQQEPAIPQWLPLVVKLSMARSDDTKRNKMNSIKKPLNGLVLAGGKSERMGRDKTRINWHGKEQCYYISDLLKPFCSEVFISCRHEQQQ